MNNMNIQENPLTEAQSQSLMAQIEAILFMSDKPIGFSKLHNMIDPELPAASFQKLIETLCEKFNQDQHGIEIIQIGSGFQFRTKPNMSPVLRKLVKTQTLKLSNANLEVLAIIAYKQPSTKDEVDQIRGVDSAYIIRNLMEKKLIRISGRADLPGRPMLYSTTYEFLELFNLKNTTSLPALHEIEAMVAVSEIGEQAQLKTAVQEFSKVIESSTDVVFNDSKVNEELEMLRKEIARIPTSTVFIDEQILEHNQTPPTKPLDHA